MSIVKSEDSKKWINAFIAIASILAGYITIEFLRFLGVWLELEAKVGSFLVITQGVGIAIGLSVFIGVQKNDKALAHLQEVYGELVKVIWPTRDTIVKLTIGIVIAISIISGIFIFVDYLSRQLLQMIY